MNTSYGKVFVSLPDQPEQEFDLRKGTIQIGRGMFNDIVLNDTKVSRTHARIACSIKGCRIVDLGSSNGTHLNGMLVQDSLLEPGDEIMMGNARLRFDNAEVDEAPSMTVIDTMHDMNMTMTQAVMPVSLNETNSPRLVVYTPGKTWEVDLENVDSLSIGRTEENDVTLDISKVSRSHAQIIRAGNAYVIKDLNSTNGTWVGKERVTQQALEDGQAVRIGQARLIFKKGFVGESLTQVDFMPSKLRERTPVIFVPGIMGSKLWAGSECIWPNFKLLLSSPELFEYPGKTPLEPRGILDQVVIVPNLIKMDQYNRLGDYLVEDLGYKRGENFFEYAYEWRQDVRQSARQLGQAIQNWGIRPPVIIIAHSLGTLVSRYFVECLGGKRFVERMILMGGPHAGTPAGLASLTIGPNLLPFGIMGEQLRRVVASFPSAYQIIPDHPCGINQDGQPVNFLEDESWVQPDKLPLLRAAREFRQELGRSASVRTTSIFGYGLKTVSGLRIKTGGHGHLENVVYVSEPNGDDSVPQQSAFLPGTEIHPVQQHHGALFVDNDVKMRLKLELLGRME